MATIMIIGHGSIGSRHARIAAEMGHRVVIVSRRKLAGDQQCFAGVEEAVSDSMPDAVIVATETARHSVDLRALAGSKFRGPILVEKPLFSDANDMAHDGVIPSERISVAYNLRFHPLVRRMRDHVRGAKVLNVFVQAGQDLRQWRDRPIAQTYSASRAAGGGVLRDLSHELDYILWLFGTWTAVSAAGGRFGEFPGDADDAWGIVLRFASGALVTVSLDYFCNPPIRTLVANTRKGSARIDLVQGIWNEEKREVFERDTTYRRQLEAWLDGSSDMCSFQEGLAVVHLIEAIEEAALTGRTVAA